MGVTRFLPLNSQLSTLNDTREVIILLLDMKKELDALSEQLSELRGHL